MSEGMHENETSSLTIRTNPTCTPLNDFLWETARDPTTLPSVWTIFAFFYTIIIIAGVTGNLCVILAISRTKSLQTVPNMFIFSLSCSDIMVCLTSGTITPITAMNKKWIFGQTLCLMAPFLAGSFLSFSTFTLAAISVDRFLLIRFPMKKPFSHGQAFMLIVSIIIIAVGLSIPVSFVHTLKKIDPFCDYYCFEEWGEYMGQRRAYGTIVLVVQFIIPLIIIIICYTAISVRLGKSLLLKGKKRGYNWEMTMTDQQKAANKRRQRTNRMFILMVVAFSLSWVWSVMFNVLNDYKMLPRFIHEQSYLFGITTHCLSMTSTIWNPILYSLLNLQLRAAFIQLMPDCIKRHLLKEDEETLSRRGKTRNPPSTLLLTADSRLFDRSGASTPVPPSTRNGWLTPMMTGPRNSFAFPEADANSVMDYQLVSSNRNQKLDLKTLVCCWRRTNNNNRSSITHQLRELSPNSRRHSIPVQQSPSNLRRLSDNPTTTLLASNGGAIHKSKVSTNSNALIVPSIQVEETN
ncbi:Flp-18 GPCR receptor [Aphelenchoides bicaudatus]|nr:Flp-18 GPCR receptor [Aphelenchoides bicaudatus]